MTFKSLIIPASAALLIGGCATAERRWENTNSAGQGAVVGSVLGAGAGAIIAGEGDDAEGALIGAGIGAAAGYVIGNERDKNRTYQGQPYRGGQQYYDERTGRYYYVDPATGATWYANGERRT